MEILPDITESLRQKITAEIALPTSLSIINIVQYIIALAHVLVASDIHIDPKAARVRVRMRIDGQLHDELALPKYIHAEIISRIKILAGLRTDEHQTAQDGRCSIALENTLLDVRVSVMPTYYGENAILRLLAKQHQALDLDSLGFSTKDKEKIVKALARPHGIILATGPTGSGKTTTLYALIELLNKPSASIITIEDPIEYSLAGINQIGVNAKTGLSFANALRAILRQDPNIIMVGEIRDKETAGLAINIALTGHLVLSTIHTSDAATTLPRLIDLGIEPYLIASTMSLAIGQRLVRKICQHCKQVWQMSDAEHKSLAKVIPPENLGGQTIFYRGAGCQQCHGSGYRGRVCINEVLVVDAKIQEAIHQKATAAHIKQLARAQAMTSMIEDGFAKAKLGITTIEEILQTLYE